MKSRAFIVDDNVSLGGSLHDEGRDSPGSDTSANGGQNLNSSGEFCWQKIEEISLKRLLQ
jgi:hypothetical protein